MQLSLVIPLYNESESLEQLHREISEVAEENGYDIEIIFVDDGSTDQSWSVIEKIAASDTRVCGIQFRRNFGKAAALQAGFNAAQGELVLTLDADLQDDPKEIPDFLRQIDSGLDVVSGWKQRRYDPWHKVFPSRVFNAAVSWLTGIKLHDHNCGMKCYRREVIENVALYGERHRFIPVLAGAQGYKVGEKVVVHRARQFGHSKYGFARFFKGFLDLLTVWFLTKYGQRPQHFLGTIGLLLVMVGIVIYCCQFCWEILHLRFPLLPHYDCMLPITVGVLLIVLGLVLEALVARTIQPERCYSVKREWGKTPNDIDLQIE
jgi:dolichol-phosphate mannosyltransferase